MRESTKQRRSGRSQEPPRPAEFDMTPMIDVTFQLIVFFLVANDLSRKEIVELELPRALCATDEHPESERIIVNLRPRRAEHELPVAVVRGRELDLAQLTRELRIAADRDRPGGTGQPSDVKALLRADRAVPWRDVQLVMQACAQPSVRIHRLQFATRLPEDRGAAARSVR